MKIVNLAAFLNLPSGTVYAKYRPAIFGDLCIKGDSLPPLDWMYDAVIEVAATGSDDQWDKLEDARLNGTELEMDFNSTGRDGMYEPDQLFAVFSGRDTKALMARLFHAVYPTNDP